MEKRKVEKRQRLCWVTPTWAITSDLGKYERGDLLKLDIQLITTDCFQGLISSKPTCMFAPTAPYGNELLNLISYETDNYFLMDNFIQVPVAFPLQEIINGCSWASFSTLLMTWEVCIRTPSGISPCSQNPAVFSCPISFSPCRSSS